MQQKPDLNVEEWNILASRLATEGWITDSYNPKNGQRRWKATKWGERHYQKACMLTDVDQMFNGSTLEQLNGSDLGFETLSDQHLYAMNLLVDVLDDEPPYTRDRKELTRAGYEWFYAYTKLKGKKLNKYQAKSQITRSFEAILQMVFVIFSLLAHSLTMGLERKLKKGDRK